MSWPNRRAGSRMVQEDVSSSCGGVCGMDGTVHAVEVEVEARPSCGRRRPSPRWISSGLREVVVKGDGERRRREQLHSTNWRGRVEE